MNIVFDLGGVVFRWRPAVLVQQVLPQHAPGPDAAARLAHTIFEDPRSGWSAFDQGLIAPAPLAERIAARAGITPEEAMRVIDAVPAELQPLPETVALIGRLRASGQRLRYLSNMPAPYVAHVSAEPAFQAWFEAGVFSADVHLSKPDPAIYALAAERFGCGAREIVFIDDMQANVDAAVAAGWNALHFVSADRVELELILHGWWRR